MMNRQVENINIKIINNRILFNLNDLSKYLNVKKLTESV